MVRNSCLCVQWMFLFLLLSQTNLNSQKNIRQFIFGHSLIHHELQITPTPSQETSVPHWFHFLAEAGGHNYAVSGQYGFLPQHANLPPIAQWGFDFVDPVWDSDNQAFSDAGFNNVLISPGNFIQWQSPTENYFSDSISPVEATIDIIEWSAQQEDDIRFYIYESWPDMGPFLSDGFPPSMSEWESYNENLNSNFHSWFLEYTQIIKDNIPDECINLIPVGSVISSLITEAPFDQIPLTSLYEDDAPHGRPSLYFLGAMVNYMVMFNEVCPADYQPDEDYIHPIIASNYTMLNSRMWDLIQVFYNDVQNTSSNCNITKTVENEEFELKFYPNPSPGEIEVDFEGLQSFYIDILSINGTSKLLSKEIDQYSNRIDVSTLEQGMYLILVKNKFHQILDRKQFIKLRTTS